MPTEPGKTLDAPDTAPRQAPSGRTGVVTARTLSLYSLPLVAVGFTLTLFNLFFLKFATDHLLLALATVGLIFGLSRVWDALTDPTVGYWSDRTRTRWGRRRPWILASALPLALTSFALWNPPGFLSEQGLVTWVAISLFLLMTAQTTFSIPHASLGAELTTDHHARSRVFGSREMADKVGLFLALGGVMLLENAANPQIAATWMLGVAGSALILIQAPSLSLRHSA